MLTCYFELFNEKVDWSFCIKGLFGPIHNSSLRIRMYGPWGGQYCVICHVRFLLSRGHVKLKHAITMNQELAEGLFSNIIF